MITLNSIRRAIVLTIWTVLLLSCSSGNIPQSQHYLLATPHTATDSSANLSDLFFSEFEAGNLIAISVALPTYLRSRGIVLLDGDREVHVANQHFWAEPFDEGIARVLRDQLLISDFSGFSGLEIEVHYFHGNTDGKVLIDVSWAVIESCGEKVSWRFQASTRQQSDGYSSLVEAHVHLLALLTEEIVVKIRSQSGCA